MVIESFNGHKASSYVKNAFAFEFTLIFTIKPYSSRYRSNNIACPQNPLKRRLSPEFSVKFSQIEKFVFEMKNHARKKIDINNEIIFHEFSISREECFTILLVRIRLILLFIYLFHSILNFHHSNFSDRAWEQFIKRLNCI